MEALERTRKFRDDVKKNHGRRLDIAFDGGSLEALEAVRLQRGFRHPREVLSTLLAEERARLQNAVTAQADRPEISTLNAGVLVRSIIGCVPNATGPEQQALAQLLPPLFRAGIEGSHSAGDKLSLLRLLSFVPVSDVTVERVQALAQAPGVSATTRRALAQAVQTFLANTERDHLYDLLEAALETLAWNGLLRG